MYAAVAALEARVTWLERIEAQRSTGRSRGGGRDGAGVAALREQARALLVTGCSQDEAAPPSPKLRRAGRRLGVTRQYVHRLIHSKI